MINYLIGINIFGLIVCYCDKRAAITNKFRMAENILLFLSLMGGCFGFSLGMALFRHKTKKNKFILFEMIFIIFWILIIYKELII